MAGKRRRDFGYRKLYNPSRKCKDCVHCELRQKTRLKCWYGNFTVDPLGACRDWQPRGPVRLVGDYK